MIPFLNKQGRRNTLFLILGVLVLVILVLGTLLLVRRCSYGHAVPTLPDINVTARLDSIVFKSNQRVYGLPAENYELQQGEVQSGETFSKLLNQRFGVNIAVVNQLVDKSNGVFDLRTMRAGKGYTAFLTPDSTHALCYLIYEKSLSEYITFSLCDSISVTKTTKQVITEEQYAEITINNSLSYDADQQGLNSGIVNRIDGIYNGTIDLYALQRGDRVRILFESEYIDTICIGVSRVYGCEFIHNGKSYWAFRFNQDDENGYWDDKGESMNKSFMRAPLSISARITSKFGMRVHPIRRIRAAHNGVDYACPVGTPVVAAANGVVSRRGWDSGGGGNTLWIKHSQGYETGYLHLSRFAVAAGTRVSKGQVIAYSGNTGGSTGPHLDYRIKKNGKYINPLSMATVSETPPIKAANKAAFEQVKTDMTRVMNEYGGKR